MMNITWSWDEPDEDERKDEIDFPECLAEDLLQAELEMQALDAKLDPDGLDKEGQQAWEEYQAELGYADKDIIASGNSEEFCGEF